MAKNKKPEVVAEEPVKEKKASPVNYGGSAPVQLTPIIQPIAFVPYSSQEQPLYMYDDEETVEEFEEEAAEVAAAPVAKKKKVSAAAIFLIIFSLLIAAVYVVAKWFDASGYILVVNSTSGLDLILDWVADFSIDIFMIAIAVAAVFAVLTLLASLIRIKRKGACVFAKITTFIGLVGALVALIMALMDSAAYDIGYGLYAIAGLSLINVLIAYLAKND